VELMLAYPSAPFSRKGWLFEIKYDGFRLLAAKEGGRPSLRYRSGGDATAAFPEIARALEALPTDHVVLDTEVVVPGTGGRPSFQRLQKRFQSTRAGEPERQAASHPAVLFAFDLLGWEDFDVRPLPLIERKALLQEAIEGSGALLAVDHLAEAGERLFEEAKRLGMEGVVAKRANSAYVSGRTSDWLKFRVDRTGDFVIIGYTKVELGHEGGLHLAAMENGRLVYAGRVGSGFKGGVLMEVRRLLSGFVCREPACGGPVPRTRGHVWIEPRVVCEVRYKECTEEGLLRQPVFLRFRPDKVAEDCGRDLRIPP